MTAKDLDDNGLINLGNAIIYDAVKDRKKALTHKTMKQAKRDKLMKETKIFFTSSWFDCLADFIGLSVEGENLMELMNERYKRGDNDA